MTSLMSAQGKATPESSFLKLTRSKVLQASSLLVCQEKMCSNVKPKVMTKITLIVSPAVGNECWGNVQVVRTSMGWAGRRSGGCSAQACGCDAAGYRPVCKLYKSTLH